MNIQKLMKQAQEMQQKVKETQDKLEGMEVIGQSGGGLVKVTTNCKNMVKNLSIDKTIINPKEPEFLEDLIVAAINDAHTKVNEKSSEEMNSVTGGMGLPDGMKLPF